MTSEVNPKPYYLTAHHTPTVQTIPAKLGKRNYAAKVIAIGQENTLLRYGEI